MIRFTPGDGVIVLGKFTAHESVTLRVRTVAKRHMRSSMFTASFILVSGVKLP